MSRRKKPLAVLVLLPALSVLAWFFPPRPPDPVCNGKRLSEWLEVYKPPKVLMFDSPEPLPNCEEADAAIRLAGTNAIPLLIKYMKAHDNRVKRMLMAMADRQHFIESPFVPAGTRILQAERAFKRIGCLSAVPELTRIYNENPVENGPAVIEAVEVFGPLAVNTIPLLICAMTNPVPEVRLVSVRILSRMTPPADLVMPNLIKCLDDTNVMVIYFDVCLLERFGPLAKPALSALVKVRRTLPTLRPAPCLTGSQVIPFVDAVIRHIDPEAK